jgi:hypothetical protein
MIIDGSKACVHIIQLIALSVSDFSRFGLRKRLRRASIYFKDNKSALELPNTNGSVSVLPPPRSSSVNGNTGRASAYPLSSGVWEHRPYAQHATQSHVAREPMMQSIPESDGGSQAPGDDIPQRRQNQLVTSDELRELGELIRERYRLDMLLHHLRNRTSYEGDVIRENIRRSTAVLAKIRRLVDSFDRPDLFETRDDHYKLLEIKRRIYEGGKRDWTRNPPRPDDGLERAFEREFQPDIQMRYAGGDEF